MINRIYLKSIATFSSPEGAEINELARINFFYGSNGSGKTTLSKVLKDCSRYNDCYIEWAGNPEKTYVYSQEYIHENFYAPEALEGVFTLGVEAREIEAQIETKLREKDRFRNKIQTLETTLQRQEAELEQIDADFTEQCWLLKRQYEGNDSGFKIALTGTRGSKQEFKEKILAEIAAFEQNLTTRTETEITADVQILFSGDVRQYPIPPLLELEGLRQIESNSILSLNIVGKQDVAIADLVTFLGNSDWVKQGKQFLELSEDKCPFCQQDTTGVSLKAQLEAYFDDSFEQQMRELRGFADQYSQTVNNIINHLENLLATENEYLPKEELSTRFELFRSKTGANIGLIEQKQAAPSQIVTIEPVTAILEDINTLLNDVIGRTSSHNEKVANTATKQEELKQEIWRFFALQIQPQLDLIEGKKRGVNRAIQNISGSIRTSQLGLHNVQQEVGRLKSTIASVEPTIIAINKMLMDFGFMSFSLRKSNQGEFYEIIRADGSNAKETLSEGEKTFLTFLYFLHQINSKTDNCVVVLDDPISSLDSSVLFIVSSLIRDLLNRTKSGEGYVKQVFLLTHNIYFHKEVTFRYDGNSITHWIIKKHGSQSVIEAKERNPITSSYQLLWDEVKVGNIVTVRNAMRRILEYYFQHLGHTDLNNLYQNFTGEDRLLCKSLVSWVHDGSHSISDDLFIQDETSQVDKYQAVFKAVFDVKGHLPHYDMMMGN